MDTRGLESLDAPLEPLTRREREILALLADNRSNHEIADQLALALSSVKWYTRQIYGKLGVNSRQQAIARARQVGLIAATPARSRPSGTVTFLFTDIEGSTQLWEHHPEAMRSAFARQEAIVREVMAAHGGHVYKMVGDAFQVAFSTALAALAAALAAQSALQAEPWGDIGTLWVRMALHTGAAEERVDDYVGPDLNRAARLLSAGHGGQVLLTQSACDLVRDHLPAGISLRDLGEHTLKDLVRPEHIYQLVSPDLAQDFPPLKTIEVRPGNLPLPATPFVGREAELARIEALLNDPGCRLISLVGIGGTGKTRLAIQAAAQSQAFPHGVYLISLAAVSTLDGMLAAVADALQMPFEVRTGLSLPSAAAQAQLLRYLFGKKALLVLDNLEQLAAHADLLTSLIEAAPGIKLLVTSRERLNLSGEWVLDVTGLSFPGSDEREAISQYAAVQLFVQGAERGGPFAAAPSDWPAIARICQLVEGMPLGIEMAAAWTKVLSCQEIAAEIERDLDFLTVTWRGMPERHRTLRAVFEHSWRLLSDEERNAFCRLSVFRSGFDRQAAAEIAGASLPLLGAFIDKSFLRRASERRFEVHPVLQQYAAEKLAANPPLQAEAQSCHAGYYGEWLRRMGEELKGSRQLEALVALRTDMQNVYGAWQWLIEHHDLEQLRRVLPAMVLFYEMHDQPIEAREAARLLLDMLRTPSAAPIAGADTGSEPTVGSSYVSLLALVLAALHHFSLDPEHFERSVSYQRESLPLVHKLPDGQDKAFILLLNAIGPGTLTAQQSLELCQQCIGIFQRQGDAWGMALSQLILADTANLGGLDADLARASYQASLEGFARLGNDWGRALCLVGLALTEQKARHLEAAYRLGRQGLDIYDQMGNVWRASFVRQTLGEIAEELGAFDEARRHFEANLACAVQMGDDRQRDYYIERLARLSSAGTESKSAYHTLYFCARQSRAQKYNSGSLQGGQPDGKQDQDL